jgi:Rrf2 family protein
MVFRYLNTEIRSSSMKGASVFKISDSTILAFHAMAILTSDLERSYSVKEMALELKVSGNHLSKVLQRLAKAGYVNSVRGPNGGFSAAKKAGQSSLLELYELNEGPLPVKGCLFGTPRCKAGTCRLNDFLEDIGGRIENFLSKTNLSQLTTTKG